MGDDAEEVEETYEFSGENCTCEHDPDDHDWGDECAAELPDGTSCTCEAGWSG